MPQYLVLFLANDKPFLYLSISFDILGVLNMGHHELHEILIFSTHTDMVHIFNFSTMVFDLQLNDILHIFLLPFCSNLIFLTMLDTHPNATCLWKQGWEDAQNLGL